MKCKNCGNEISEEAKFCSNCGTRISNNNPDEEKINYWLVIASFLVPIVGLIVYLTQKDTDPKTAKYCGICALVSFISPVVFGIMFFLLVIFPLILI